MGRGCSGMPVPWRGECCVHRRTSLVGVPCWELLKIRCVVHGMAFVREALVTGAREAKGLLLLLLLLFKSQRVYQQ
jgi:hypothetical protein